MFISIALYTDESTTVLIDLRVECDLNAIITLIWCQQLFFIVLVVYGYVFYSLPLKLQL